MSGKRRTVTGAAGRNGLIQRLIELQAVAQMQIAKADERMARADERFAHLQQSIGERFARIDERFAHIEQAIAALARMLEALPDAVREKIGFAAAQP